MGQSNALLIMILQTVLLGGLAAVVFGFIYGVVHKRPGIIAASVLVPVLLCATAITIPLFVRIASMAQSGKISHVEWSMNSPMPSMPVDALVPIVFKLAILLLIVVGVVGLIRKCTSCNWQRSGSWIKTLAIAVLVVGALNLTLRVQSGRTQVATEVERRSELSRRNDEIARLNEAQSRQVADAAEQRAIELLASRNMQELWEKLNQPRIKLDGDQHGATKRVGDGVEQVALESPPADGMKSIAPTAEPTPESLASSLARLERMVDQVSAVADRVSDTGTLIGKAMIAINETMDTRKRAKDRIPETTAEKAIETAEREDQIAVAMAPILTLPARKTLEIAFDQERLNQYATSFERIKNILGRDGFWRGTKVRFVPQELRIVVTSDLEDDYGARLSGTLINTLGKHRTPIHLSDVATIAVSPALVASDGAGGRSTGERPAWVDEAPKNVGNVRRQVIVAGEFATLEECNREMDSQLYLATFNRIREIANAGWEPLGTTDSAATQMIGSGIVGIDFIRREIAKQEYFETVERSFGPMKKLYTQIEFSPSIDQELLRRWDEFRRSERFVQVGAGAGSVLGLIGLAFGLLRVDTWTKGYYSKRLFLGVPAAIIGAITLLVLAAG